MAATLIQGLFNVVDTFWVGRFLGPEALAGVSTAGFVVWLVLAVAELPAVGLAAVASRRWGEGRPEDSARAAYQAFLLGLLGAAGIGVAGLAGLDGLFALMGTPGGVTREGAGYLATWLTGTPIVFAYFAMDAAFRAAGDTRTPFVLLAVSLGANAILDPLLILGPGPLPALGIQGAALATLVTRAGGCVLGYAWLRRRGWIRRSRPDGRLLGRMTWIGLPVAAGGATFSAVYILLTRLTSEFGTAGLAALGVGHKLESLSYMVCIGFGVSAATVVGQNLGAGSRTRARRGGREALRYALFVTTAVGVLFLTVPETLIGAFTSDPDVIRAGASYLRIVAAAQVFMAVELVLQIAMEGAGYTVAPMLTTMTLTVLRLPLAALLRGPLGLAGIWWTISLTGILRGVAVAAIWRRGGWLERDV
ncbi:MAG: MATE family efflux transporter [Gemmatimonadota bacterium]|nr:MATE family efflux transporter [Gemmatimonadota bacterium]